MTAPTPNNMPATAGAEPATPVAEATKPAAAEPKSQPGPKPAAKKEPPWGSEEDFNPDKAWKLIQNLRQENAAIKAETEPIRNEWESLRRASQTENERLTEDLAKLDSSAQAWRQQAVRAEAKSLAAGRFSNADHAVTLIGDLSGFIDGDTVNTAAIKERLDTLAAENAYLLAAQPQHGLTPNRGQGQSGTGQIPFDAQIKAAQERGDVMASIALKQQQFHSAKR